MASWPYCHRCGRSVDAYGLENDTPHAIELWARCSGVMLDPETGGQVFGTPRRHEEMKSSVTIIKGAGWSDNRLRDIIARTGFFAPTEVSEGREFRQDLSSEGVAKKATV